MLRPKLRPTLSRKVKYWGIAPSAQKKLKREARRGSHDLRRLVGHANFLDELIEEFRIDDDSEDPHLRQEVVPTQEPKKLPEKDERTEYDDEDTASDSWSEYHSSDDDDHALVRTESGRLQRVEEDDSSDEEIYGIMPKLSKNTGSSSETSPASIVEGNNDYFNHHAPASTLAGETPEKNGETILVEIASPMSNRG